MQAIGRQPQPYPERDPVHFERHRLEQTTQYRLVQQHAVNLFEPAEAAFDAYLPVHAPERRADRSHASDPAGGSRPRFQSDQLPLPFRRVQACCSWIHQGIRGCLPAHWPPPDHSINALRARAEPARPEILADNALPADRLRHRAERSHRSKELDGRQARHSAVDVGTLIG